MSFKSIYCYDFDRAWRGEFTLHDAYCTVPSKPFANKCAEYLFEIEHHAIRSVLLDRRRPQRTQNDSDVFPTNPPNRREQPNWSGGAQSSVDTSSFIHVSSEPSETSSPPSTIPLASRHLTGQNSAADIHSITSNRALRVPVWGPT